MEKRCSGKETRPPSRVNLSKRLYEKKITSLPELTVHALVFFFYDARPTDFEEKIEGLLTG